MREAGGLAAAIHLGPRQLATSMGNRVARRRRQPLGCLRMALGIGPLVQAIVLEARLLVIGSTTQR